MNRLAAFLTFLFIASQAAGVWAFGPLFMLGEILVVASVFVVGCVYDCFRVILTGVE